MEEVGDGQGGRNGERSTTINIYRSSAVGSVLELLRPTRTRVARSLPSGTFYHTSGNETSIQMMIK